MNDRIDPASSLLEHAAFLRRLAVQLAGPDADDLAQDTWAATLSRPPRSGHSPRGWLATVAGNLWRNQRRAASRRAARERAMARSDDVPGVDEIAAREEVRRRVVAAVLALPEELREVVVLRFYEGLDSRAIGARLGRPPSTVRGRLQTALDRLRLRLDAEHGGRRAAWVLPLAEWRRFLAEPAVPGVMTGIAARLVAGAVLVAGLAVWWSWPADENPLPEVPSIKVAQAAGAGAEAGGDLESRRTPAETGFSEWVKAQPVVAYESSRPVAALSGVVRSAVSGRPLIGTHVTLRALPAASSAVVPLPDERRVERKTRTDGAGSFTFARLPAGLYEVAAVTAEGLSDRRVLTLARGSEDVELLASEQPYRGLLAIRVTDPTGLPVAGAEITVVVQCTRFGAIGWGGSPPIEGTTDFAGRWVHRDTERLEHVFEGLVVARAPDGRIGISVIARPEHRGNDPWFEVQVDRPAAIAGRLVGPRSDWSGARVTAQAALVYDHVLPQPAAGELAAAVSSDGTFELAGLAAGRYHLQVDGVPGVRRVLEDETDNWQFLPVVRIGAGETLETVIDLAAAVEVRGRVRDDNGRPIARAQVMARWAPEGTPGVYHHETTAHAPSGPYTAAKALTDADGRYRLTLRPGTWNVTATAAGRSLDVQLGLPAATDDPDGGTVELDHVLVADGGLRARAATDHVALRAMAAPAIVHVFATEDGMLATRGLAPGRWQVGLHGEHGFRPLTSVEVVAGEAPWIDLTALGGGPVRGIVHVGGRPAADVDVLVGGDGPTARTAADGSFVMSGGAELLAAGLPLWFAHRGQRFAVRHDAHAPGGDLGVLGLGARRVDVRAVEGDGSHAAATLWVMVSYFDLRQPTRWFVEDGRLDGQLAPPGQGWVFARFEDGSEVSAEIGAGDQTVELQRKPAGSLDIRLLHGDGLPRVAGSLRVLPWGRSSPAPKDGAAFYAGRDPEASLRLARTDAEGRALVRGLPPGPVLVWYAGSWSRFGYETRGIGHEGPPPAEQVARVQAGRTTTVDLVLR